MKMIQSETLQTVADQAITESHGAVFVGLTHAVSHAISTGVPLTGSFEVTGDGFFKWERTVDMSGDWGDIQELLPGFIGAIPENNTGLRFSGNTAIRLVEGEQRKVSFEPQVARLLAALAVHSPDTVSRKRIMDTAWPNSNGVYGSGNTVNVHISRLRKALGSVHLEGDTSRYTGSSLGVNVSTGVRGYYLEIED